MNPVCLIQLATLDRAFIYRLSRGQPLPPVLQAVLADPHVLKVGHSLHDDFRQMKASQLVQAVNATVDTLPIANKLGCLRPGLRTLCQLFLGGAISKDMQVSNWEATRLSPAQVKYAATDAWAPLRGAHHDWNGQTDRSMDERIDGCERLTLATDAYVCGRVASLARDAPARRDAAAAAHEELQQRRTDGH